MHFVIFCDVICICVRGPTSLFTHGSVDAQTFFFFFEPPLTCVAVSQTGSSETYNSQQESESDQKKRFHARKVLNPQHYHALFVAAPAWGFTEHTELL